jgi:hypothetical protein
MIRPPASVAVRALVLAAACAAWPDRAGAQAVESAYTTLDLDKCRHVRGKAPEDYGEWFCRGHGGIAVWISGGDQRSAVSFGPQAKREPAAQETLSAFNSEGKTVEWRITRAADGKRKSFATIVRWNTTVALGDDDAKALNSDTFRGQVLVVTRLPPGGVCHVGYVDGRANADANVLAREIADRHARDFRCGTDKPIVLGTTGPGFSKPYGQD